MSEAPKPEGGGKYLLFWLMLGSVFVLDQVTKGIIEHTESLPFETYWPRGGIEVIPDFFYIAHVGNTGAAWGMFDGMGLALAGLAVVALAMIFIFRRHLELHRPIVQVAFGLLCGGIIGNLLDRIVRGHVVDFLDFHLPGYRFPAFNVADSGICVGVGLYMLVTILDARAEHREESAARRNGSGN